MARNINGSWIAHQGNGFNVTFNLTVTNGLDQNGALRSLVNGTN